jgi:hypothetical protein
MKRTAKLDSLAAQKLEYNDDIRRAGELRDPRPELFLRYDFPPIGFPS